MFLITSMVVSRNVKRQTERDARFVRVKNKIRHALNMSFRRHVAHIRAYQLTRQAGISRSAFYKHYCDINDAVRQIEQEIVADFRRGYESLRARGSVTNESVYLRLLIFIHQNREDVQAAIDRQSYGLLLALLAEIRPEITKRWPHYSAEYTKQLFRLYAGQAIAMIVIWIEKTKCSKSTLSALARQLATLADSAPHYYQKYLIEDKPKTNKN